LYALSRRNTKINIDAQSSVMDKLIQNKPKFVIAVEATHRADGATVPRIKQILTHINEQQKINKSWFVIVVGNRYADKKEFGSFHSFIDTSKSHFVNLNEPTSTVRAAAVAHVLGLCYDAKLDCIYVHATDEMAWDANHLESLQRVYDDKKRQASFVSTIARDRHSLVPSTIGPVHWSQFSAVRHFDANWHAMRSCAISLRVKDFVKEQIFERNVHTNVLLNVSRYVKQHAKNSYLVRQVTATRTIGIELHNCSWNENTEFLTIINFHHGDIEWRHKLAFPFVVFSKNIPEREPYNARNKAKSETNLLKFVYEFYDILPQNVVYVHQYERKWHHNGSLVDILNNADLPKNYKQSKTRGFFNFNTWLLEPIKEGRKVTRMLESGWWKACMQPYFGNIHQYKDFTANKRGCAQFVVSRDRIRSLPRTFYKNMYDWLVANSTGTGRGVPHQSPLDNFYTSRYLEWTWELIFTVYKPHESAFVPVRDEKDNAGIATSIKALYGADKYLVDVTHLFIKHFYDYQSNSVTVSAANRLNDFFGDVVCNSVKELQVSIKKHTAQSNDTWTWYISENRQSQWHVDLNALE